MSMNSFYSKEELKEIGFKQIGDNVLLSRKASFYSPDEISIGSNVRIDDFCILSGNIDIGNYIHISAACFIFGGNVGVKLEDFTTVSSRTAIYAKTDDYSGSYLTNPTLPNQFRGVIEGRVVLKKHSIIGSGCTVLPNVIIGIGTAVGSMSLVNKSLDEWGIYAGIPCRFIKERSRHLLTLENEFLTM